MKPSFTRKQKRKRHGKAFWDAEYTTGGHLKLSENVSEDFAKFLRWLHRHEGKARLNPTMSAVDFGCGNGRNLVYLAREFGMRGVGYDISDAAIREARRIAAELPLTFSARSIAGTFDLPDNSQALALDMMTSHFLSAADRDILRDEIYRVLRPGGYLFMKTFLRDDDRHTTRLLTEHPADEPSTYIHPVMGVPEYVPFAADLAAFLEERFVIHKMYYSHKHVSKGKARKRRTVSVYAEKPAF